MKKRKTLDDVAAVAGVSRMTTSRALRGDKDVSQANIDRVRQAARDIGYVGNYLAASLSSKRSDLIGVIVPNLENIVFAQVMTGITDALGGTGLQPVFGITDYDLDKEYDIVRGMLSWRPAGLIITGMDLSAETRKLLQDADIPVVQIMDSDGVPIDGCVGFSHVQAGYDMGTALIEAGRKKFGYIGCNLVKDLRAARRRVGFLKALENAGLGILDEANADGLSSVENGRQLTQDLRSRQTDLDCIYYSNDDLAIGGLFHFLDAGIQVPEQIALSGFNGLDLLDGAPGKVATTRTQRREIGNTAVNLIMDSLDGRATGGSRIRILQPQVDLGALSSS